MTFEHLPFTDQDKHDIGYAAIRSRNSFGALTHRKWTVDRERNAFLLWGGVERDPPYLVSYCFSMDGMLFNPTFRDESRISEDGKFTRALHHVDWHTCIQDKQPTEADTDRAKLMLPEALEVNDKGTVRTATHELIVHI